jgi:hypothetical protein
MAGQRDERDDRYVPAAVRKLVRERDGGECTTCGTTEDLQFDHIHPWSRGGTSKDAVNIQLLCGPCNLRKRDYVTSNDKPVGFRLDPFGPTFKPDSLVGSYFHGDAEHQYQGAVVAEPHPGIYLVEFFSWLHGGSCWQELIRIEGMFGWRFYDDIKWMNQSYEAGSYPWAKKESDGPS